MKKKYLGIFIIFYIFTLYAFAETCTSTLDGNAHILSYSDLKRALSTNLTIYTANELYRAYESLRISCGNNELLFDEKRETEFANKLIKLTGYVKEVRRSILNEYIVELGTTETFSWNIGVVYPKRISQAMKSELMKLREGDYFEAVVITRNTYMYVDVPVWNSNGIYRTEP